MLSLVVYVALIVECLGFLSIDINFSFATFWNTVQLFVNYLVDHRWSGQKAALEVLI